MDYVQSMSHVRIRRFDANLLLHSMPWMGQVEALFDTAVVVRPVVPGPRLTLLAPHRSLVPWGVGFLWSRADELFEGCLVALRGRRMMVGLRGGHLPLMLSGPGVSLGLARLVGPASHAVLLRQFEALGLPPRVRGLLGQGQMPSEGSLDKALLRAVAAPAAALVQGLVQGQVHQDLYAESSRALAGLGTGLTPTGDDLLVGLLAASERFALLGWISDAARDALLAAVNDLPRHCTTPVSREMLAHAVGGSYPEALVDLVRHLGREGVSIQRWGQAVAWLQEVGSDSGVDMLSGVLALVQGMLASRAP